MGGHHAISGAAAWLALTGSATIGDRALGAGVLDLTGPEVLAGTVVATGAALLPDIDHPSATIARSAGAVSRLASSAISSATGHRGATHTLLAVAVFTALGAVVAGLGWSFRVPVVGPVQIGAVVVVAVLCAFAVRALKLVSGALRPWLIGIGAGLLVGVAAPATSVWLPAAIGLGALVHLLGDLVTTDGIPFPTWPLVLKPSERSSSPLWQADGDVAVPILGNAGSAREWALCAVLSLYVAVAAVATILP
ncbi:metal-dependent hydrolase [Brachybacterium sp. P6-10-X1]|uniref:metal-dependent hydrolase n=1 Tax=Brachybacterium sp. P6-10-X1 TaxID=1903186 RepID=UPI0009F9EA88|nr:metal-dependent hydrolase [Brachybacterium sp. P6-10-X1]